MLCMLSWSKDPSWRSATRRNKRKRKDTVGWTDDINTASVSAIVRQVGTLGKTLGTVGWTDGPFPSSVRRVAEEVQQRQYHQMIRRSKWWHRRSIRRSVWIHTETCQDEPFSTGWTDALVKRNHRSIRRSQKQDTETTWSQGLQHWMDRRTVSV
jgi:hypothetical protein